MEEKRVIPLKEGNKEGNINNTQGMPTTITSHHPTPLPNFMLHGADTAHRYILMKNSYHLTKKG